MLPSLTTCPRLSAGTRVASAETASEGVIHVPAPPQQRRARCKCCARPPTAEPLFRGNFHDHSQKSDPSAPLRLNIFGAHIRGRPQAIDNNFACEIAAELRNIFVVGIQHRGSACGQGIQSVRTWRVRSPLSNRKIPGELARHSSRRQFQAVRFSPGPQFRRRETCPSR